MFAIACLPASQQVEALKVDLGAKSRAATAGWDAAANAESEAEAAEARGLRDGIKRGRAEAERKASEKGRLCDLFATFSTRTSLRSDPYSYLFRYRYHP